MSAWKTALTASLSLAAVALVVGGGFGASAATEDKSNGTCVAGNVTSCQWLFTLETDGTQTHGKNLACQFYVQETSGTLVGVWWNCNDNTHSDPYSLAQISKGIVVNHSGDHKVAQLRTDAGFDAVHGGPLTLTYLKEGKLDASDDSYETFGLQFEYTGSKWVIYTGPENGQKPFTYMFMKADYNFLGMVDGIQNILTSYNATSN